MHLLDAQVPSLSASVTLNTANNIFPPPFPKSQEGTPLHAPIIIFMASFSKTGLARECLYTHPWYKLWSAFGQGDLQGPRHPLDIQNKKWATSFSSSVVPLALLVLPGLTACLYPPHTHHGPPSSKNLSSAKLSHSVVQIHSLISTQACWEQNRLYWRELSRCSLLAFDSYSIVWSPRQKQTALATSRSS